MVDNKKLKPPRPWFGSWVRKIPWRSDWLPTPVLLTSLVAQLVKNPPALRETWVRSLGWEDPLEKGKAAAAKLLQSCPTLCDPIDRSPPGSPIPGIPTPVFWPREFHVLHGVARESDTTERLSLSYQKLFKIYVLFTSKDIES